MNINNQGFYVKKEALNLNTANKLKEEIIEKSVGESNQPTIEKEPQTTTLSPSTQQILLNNGIKINYLAKNDSIEKTNPVIEKKDIDVVVQAEEKDETTKSSTNENEPEVQELPKWLKTFGRILAFLTIPFNPIAIIGLAVGLFIDKSLNHQATGGTAQGETDQGDALPQPETAEDLTKGAGAS